MRIVMANLVRITLTSEKMIHEESKGILFTPLELCIYS